jgi:hypothetical protein
VECDENLWIPRNNLNFSSVLPNRVLMVATAPPRRGCARCAIKMTKRQLSLSYEELSRAGRDELKRLVEADLLDEPTRARCVHLARFFEKVSQMAGPMQISAIVGDVLSEKELQKIWRETVED